ncbi:MAG: DUF2461 domain-containing protein [Planctomycetota bacterium]
MSFFTKELFTFLSELEENNDRKWFEKNKSRYEDVVRTPALEFIAAMEKPLKKISPHVLAVPKKVGGSLMRIYRDVRFSKDKSPYKTNLGIQFRHEAGKDVHAPGFYFHVDTSDIFVGAGLWHPENTVLAQIRTAIDEEPAKWKRVAHGKKMTAAFRRYDGESLKRPPRGFDKDHPLIEDLKLKDHILLANLKRSDVTGKQLVNRLTDMLKLTRPYMRFLCDSIRLPF